MIKPKQRKGGGTMKRTLIILAIAAIAAPWSLVADEVLSRNAVGYVKLDLAGNSLFLGTLNFNSLSGDMDINTAFSVDSFPTGSKIWLWDSGAQSYGSVESIIAPPPTFTKQWSPGTNVLDIGQAYWIEVAGTSDTNYEVYLMGEVPSTTNVDLSIGGGMQFIAFPYPVAMPLTNTALTDVMQAGDKVWAWDAATTNFVVESCIAPPPTFTPQWSPGTMVLEPGAGFIYERTSVTNWSAAKPYTWP
jgi:hypothetical protein